MAQIVEADVLASGALEDIRQPLSDGGRLPRIVGIHRRREGHTIRNTLKTVLLLGISFLLLAVENWLEGIVSVSGLLAIMSMAMVYAVRTNAGVVNRLKDKYGKLWLAAEVVLFVLVGAAVDIRYTLSAGLGAWQ